VDARAWFARGPNDAALRQLVADFESIKKSKDLLVPYPAKAQAARNEQKAQAGGRVANGQPVPPSGSRR
jgi:hypothetical protein